jgi:mannose-1-phosphate guanylyltransferase
MSNRYIFIMAGGRGERFWPQSRVCRPKHLLPVVGDSPMLAQTVERLGTSYGADRIFVITNRTQAAAVAEVCPALPATNIISEPVGRDTAAAVALATALVLRRDPQASFAMLPADHCIADHAGFQRTVDAAFCAAEAAPTLVTIGIQPDWPATGYGYIEVGAETARIHDLPVLAVHAFREKPAQALAEQYVAGGRHLWNAGMFFWQASVIAAELAAHAAAVWEPVQAAIDGMADDSELDAVLDTLYPPLTRISIDYAVMEKAAHVAVVPAAFDWDDVGEWPAVARHTSADAAGNAVRGEALLVDAHNNLVVSSAGHTIALLGVDDLVVVHTADATLVCRRDRAQDVKLLVQQLAADPARRHLV